MITAKQKDKALADNAALITAIADFKALTTVHELPITSDIVTLETALRGQLFQKLLSVDKGMKMRFDMLKTDEARVKLITETVNLDGYSQVTELRTALEVIERDYNRVYTGSIYLRSAVPFLLFVDKFKMDLNAVLNSLVFDWTGREDALEYFQNLAPTLTTLRDTFRAVTHSTYSLHEMLMLLGYYYTPESNKDTIEAEESAVMNFAKDLQDANAMHLVK